MKAYHKQQEEIAHIKKYISPCLPSPLGLTLVQVHCERRYLRQSREASQVEAEDYR